MLFFIYHVLLFTAGFIQAAPPKVQQSSPQPKSERCNVDLAWDGKQEAVSGRALRGSKIDCRKGFYVTGVWNDQNIKAPPPDCCIEIECGKVHGVRAGFCTTNCPHPGKAARFDTYTCPGIRGYTCCMGSDIAPPTSGPMTQGEVILPDLEAMMTDETTPPLVTEYISQPFDTYSAISGGEDFKISLNANPEISTLGPGTSTLNLGFLENPEDTLQALNIGSGAFDCMVTGTCSTIDTVFQST